MLLLEPIAALGFLLMMLEPASTLALSPLVDQLTFVFVGGLMLGVLQISWIARLREQGS